MLSMWQTDSDCQTFEMACSRNPSVAREGSWALGWWNTSTGCVPSSSTQFADRPRLLDRSHGWPRGVPQENRAFSPVTTRRSVKAGRQILIGRGHSNMGVGGGVVERRRRYVEIMALRLLKFRWAARRGMRLEPLGRVHGSLSWSYPNYLGQWGWSGELATTIIWPE